MPFVKVWIHFVWSTKNRQPLLNDSIRKRVFQHIRENAKAKGIFLDYINGYVEHVHCLISLGTEQKISEIVKLIKDSGYKVQVAIMDDIIRVTGKKIDDLQEVIQASKTWNLGLALQYVNMKS